MTKETQKPASPEQLVETSKKGAIELSEQELKQVAGGRKAGGDQQEFLKIKLDDTLISG
jgi:bacteriocin-like protein